jgi:hypothetical protein
VLRHAVERCRHTFRGSTWRTWLGLEPERDAFRRYRAIRHREREYLAEPSGGPRASTGDRVARVEVPAH